MPWRVPAAASFALAPWHIPAAASFAPVPLLVPSAFVEQQPLLPVVASYVPVQLRAPVLVFSFLLILLSLVPIPRAASAVPALLPALFASSLPASPFFSIALPVFSADHPARHLLSVYWHSAHDHFYLPRF